ncbi:MAG: hypothetical protein ACRC92_27220 [Peptostreptococcaceae bacterium]
MEKINNLMNTVVSNILSEGNKEDIAISTNMVYNATEADINDSIKAAEKIVKELKDMSEAMKELGRFVSMERTTSIGCIVYLSDDIVVTKDTARIVICPKSKEYMERYNRVELTFSNIPSIQSLDYIVNIGSMKHISLDVAKNCILFTSSNGLIKLSLYDLALHVYEESEMDKFVSSVNPIISLEEQRASIRHRGLEIRKIDIKPKPKYAIQYALNSVNQSEIDDQLK